MEGEVVATVGPLRMSRAARVVGDNRGVRRECGNLMADVRASTMFQVGMNRT